MYFLRRLCKTMLRMFYESVVFSAVFYAVLCWGGSLKVADIKRLNKLIKKADSVLGEELDPLETAADRRVVSRLVHCPYRSWTTNTIRSMILWQGGGARLAPDSPA